MEDANTHVANTREKKLIFCTTKAAYNTYRNKYRLSSLQERHEDLTYGFTLVPGTEDLTVYLPL